MNKAELKILQCLHDNFNMNYLAKDSDGSLYAYQSVPTFDNIEQTWSNSECDSTYMCDIAYENLNLDHDLDIDVKDVKFDNLSSTTCIYDINALIHAEN